MSDNPVLERAERFLSALRHCQVLGMSVHAAKPEGLTLRLPYSTQIIGNPETGVIHGGAITTLMDTTCGISTVCVLPQFEICPTLDLRIDYMRPATPGQTIRTRAECHHVTRSVAFVRVVATDEDETRPVAIGNGAFTIESRGSVPAGRDFRA